MDPTLQIALLALLAVSGLIGGMWVFVMIEKLIQKR
jgi:hypothetical protein